MSDDSRMRVEAPSCEPLDVPAFTGNDSRDRILPPALLLRTPAFGGERIADSGVPPAKRAAHTSLDHRSDGVGMPVDDARREFLQNVRRPAPIREDRRQLPGQLISVRPDGPRTPL